MSKQSGPAVQRSASISNTGVPNEPSGFTPRTYGLVPHGARWWD